MKTVDYFDAPKMCSRLLAEVSKRGGSVEFVKKGRPFVRMVPVDAADVRALEILERVRRRRKSKKCQIVTTRVKESLT